jgi:hypothetical protein
VSALHAALPLLHREPALCAALITARFSPEILPIDERLRFVSSV